MPSTRILTALLLATTLVATAPAQIFGIFPSPEEAPMQPLEDPPLFDQGPPPLEEEWEDPAAWDDCLAEGYCLDFPPFMLAWDDGVGMYYDANLDLFFDPASKHFFYGDDPWGTPLLAAFQTATKPKPKPATKTQKASPKKKPQKKKPTKKLPPKRRNPNQKPVKKKS